MAFDVNTFAIESLKQAPAIIAAVGLAYWRIRRKQDEALANQKRIESKVNGNHKITMKAIRAQGKLEGVMKGKKEAHEEIEHVTKVLAKATKRGSRRSTDK